MQQIKRPQFLILTVLTLTLHLCLFTLPLLAQTLCIQNEAGETVWQHSLPDDTCFAIRFIHSVAKSPVEDWFCARKGTLFLEKTVYHDFGAGLPFSPEGDQKMTIRDGQIILDGFNRPLPSFDQRVGRIANHTLLYPEHGKILEKKLSDFAKPGRALTFSLIQ